MESIEIVNDEQGLNWLTAICYMQEKYNYFMSDDDYKKFRDYIATERNRYNKGICCFECAMQNIFSTFTAICYAGSKSWALMLVDIAKEMDLDELLRICNMRVKFDKQRFKS